MVGADLVLNHPRLARFLTSPNFTLRSRINSLLIERANSTIAHIIDVQCIRVLLLFEDIALSEVITGSELGLHLQQSRTSSSILPIALSLIVSK